MRLSFSDLVAYIGPVWIVNRKPRPNYGDVREVWTQQCDFQTVADAVGRDRNTTARWAKTGLSLNLADKVAEALRCHPMDIFGVAYLEAQWEPVKFDPHSLGLPEAESPGMFCGRPVSWQAIGRDAHYGVYS